MSSNIHKILRALMTSGVKDDSHEVFILKPWAPADIFVRWGESPKSTPPPPT